MRAAFHVSALGLLALTLVACITDNSYVVYEAGTDQRAKSASKSASKETSKAAPKQSAASAKSALTDSVRADLRGNCLMEHGGLFGGGETVTKQCDCYAAGIVKTMSRDDLDLYSQYKVLSTLSVAKPEDVKKQCGFTHIPSPRGSRVPGT